MSADALFWIALTILVGIYAIWREEERDARGRERRNHPLNRPLGRPPEAG